MGSTGGGGLSATKAALIALAGIMLATGVLIVGGSEDPPPNDCLSAVPAAVESAASANSGNALKAAADQAVADGRAKGLTVAVAITDAAKPSASIVAGSSAPMPSASVIKLAVALAAGKKVDAGVVTMNQVAPLLNPMISVSDNTATNQLVDLLGGADVVNSTVAALGISRADAHLGRELGASFTGPDPNTLTIAGANKLLQTIYDSSRDTGALRSRISKSSADTIIAAMKAQTVNTKFGAVLDHSQIAHKTGELGGTSHDVGWFFSGDRWLAVSALTTSNGSDQTAGNTIIKAFAKKVFDARDAAVTAGGGDRAPPATTSAAPAPSGPNTSDKTKPLKASTYQLSSPFGQRGGEFHRGTDFSAALGTPIYAATGGTVAESGPADGFGNWIIIDFDNGKSSNVYGHMKAADLKVKAGDKVSAGQQIAAVGNEGQSSSGPHLHFELWTGGTRLKGGHAVDPIPWLRGAKEPTGTPTVNVEVRNAAAVTDQQGAGCGDVVGGTGLKPGSVPPAYVPWILKAAKTCPEVTAPLISAQLENETGGTFDVNSHNPKSGADGPSQFMPETWAAKAIDGDGDGTKNTRSIADAVMTQASYDCELATGMRKALAGGKVRGDLTELWLSAYNCGPGATLAAGGPCQNAETQSYIRKIPQRAATVFAAQNAAAAGLPAGPVGTRIVAAAMRWLGTTYAWGGGNANGPTKGIADGGVADAHGDFNKVGFDCSGLVIYAVAQATGKKIALPHYTVTQLNDGRGRAVPLAQIAPGDIVFPAGGNPQHVAIYVGDGKVVHAPQSGDVVKVSPMASAVGANPSVRRFG